MQCTAPVRSAVRVFASLMIMFAITAGLASAAEQQVSQMTVSQMSIQNITPSPEQR
jgi:hypothetical protein